jgi:outer membrane murein-binding lipoprotein Lpp
MRLLAFMLGLTLLAGCQRAPPVESGKVVIEWERVVHEASTSAQEVQSSIEGRLARGDEAARDLSTGLAGAVNELKKTHITVNRELTRLGGSATEADVAHLSSMVTEAARRVETRVSRARAMLADESKSAEPEREQPL